MDAELWKQVDALLEQAFEQPPEQRESFVAAACKDNALLHQEVLSLVKAQSKASQFMEGSAMSLAAAALAQDLTTTASLAGKELATYKIEKLLGTGGMGEVYLARDRKLDRLIALKILPWHFVADADRLERFQREARALSSLNHPNLITIYEVGEDKGVHFIAMEFVEGQTLSSLRGKLSLKELLSIVAQAAEALAAAHQSGIVHRDIKPDNVMVRPDGYAKVLDFGLVKLTETAPAQPDVAKTQLGVAMGTLAYMSPEQATGEPVDHRTDIWSLGVVLYELVTGHRPFTGETRQATINSILSSEPGPATVLDPSLPSEVDLVLNKALEKDRDLRYQTASDFRADIRRLLRAIDSSPTASSRRSFSGAVRPFVQRRWLRPVLACAAIAAAVLLVWFLMKSRPGGPDWSRAAHLQLTNLPGTEFFPVLTPDGKSFVYASDENGNFDLFVQRVGGKKATPLTPNTPSDESQPSYSPNGDRIAFRSTREPSGIYVMDPNGENVRFVTADCHYPSWSPDGKEIVCSKAGRSAPSTRNFTPSSLWIADVETGSKRLLCEYDAMQPAWSPRGARIAFWFMPPNVGRSEIATISRQGGEIQIVTNNASTNWNPVWSPDGKFLYFASDRSGNMGFWRVSIDEETGQAQGEPEAVLTPSTYNRHLSFSRDGRRLIYVQSNDRSNIQAVKFDPGTEKTIGESFWITRGDQQLMRPELSPDGSRFVVRALRGTQDDIALVQRDGTNWRDLTNDKFFDRYPRWSPDGKRIALTSDRGGHYEIWTMNADGTNLRQHSFDSPGDTSFPLWSPDGSRILFKRKTDNVVLDVNKDWTNQTLESLPATEPGQNFVIWDWSPDGKKLIGTLPASEVVYYSFDTKRYEKILDVGAYPMWLSDSLRFIFLADGKVQVADISTKRTREILSLPEGRLTSVGISRDGQLVYFAVHSTESDIWLLDLQ
jgi:eukaryotic-like serine/threonine-protein kinase